MNSNPTALAFAAFLLAVAVAGLAVAGYLIGGFIGFCVSAILIGGLAIGGTQAAALFLLDAGDKRQTVAAAHARTRR